MTQEEEEILRNAIRDHRDSQFAELFTLQLGLAVTTHPEEIRHALQHVFNLKEVERVTRRIMAVAAKAVKVAQEARNKANQAREEIEVARKELDGLQVRLGRVAKYLNRKSR